MQNDDLHEPLGPFTKHEKGCFNLTSLHMEGLTFTRTSLLTLRGGRAVRVSLYQYRQIRIPAELWRAIQHDLCGPIAKLSVHIWRLDYRRASWFRQGMSDSGDRVRNTHKNYTHYWSLDNNHPHWCGVIRTSFTRMRCVRSLSPICLLRVKQPNYGLFTVPVITCVPSRRDDSYSVGHQELAPQQLIASGRDRYLHEENLDVSNL